MFSAIKQDMTKYEVTYQISPSVENIRAIFNVRSKDVLGEIYPIIAKKHKLKDYSKIEIQQYGPLK